MSPVNPRYFIRGKFEHSCFEMSCAILPERDLAKFGHLLECHKLYGLNEILRNSPGKQDISKEGKLSFKVDVKQFE